LYVLTEPPSLPDDIPNNASVIENNQLKLACPAKGTPNPRIKWYHDGKLITGNDLAKRVLPDGSLLIENAEARDAGQYTCVADNVAGNTSNTVDVKVFRELT
jgi:hypothetical protein